MRKRLPYKKLATLYRRALFLIKDHPDLTEGMYKIILEVERLEKEINGDTSSS